MGTVFGFIVVFNQFLDILDPFQGVLMMIISSQRRFYCPDESFTLCAMYLKSAGFIVLICLSLWGLWVTKMDNIYTYMRTH